MEKAGKKGNLQALSAIMLQLEREFLRLKERLEFETGNWKLETRNSKVEGQGYEGQLIRRMVPAEEEIQVYTRIISELGPKLNAFIKSTKRSNIKRRIPGFQFQVSSFTPKGARDD